MKKFFIFLIAACFANAASDSNITILNNAGLCYQLDYGRIYCNGSVMPVNGSSDHYIDIVKGNADISLNVTPEAANSTFEKLIHDPITFLDSLAAPLALFVVFCLGIIAFDFILVLFIVLFLKLGARHA